MPKQFISQHRILSLLGLAALLLMVSACRQEKATSLSTPPPVELTARLEPEEATLGDRVTYTLTVKSVLPPDMKDIHGIKPLEKASLDRRTLIIIALLVLLLAMTALAAWRYGKRKKPEVVVPPLPPHLEAEQSLRELDAMGLLQKGEFKKYYFLLSELFRRYLERRFAFPAVERTTEEIRDTLASLPVVEPLKDGIRDFLRHTDPVKFAGAACTVEEADAETDRVRHFVADTAPWTPEKSEEKAHVAV